MLWIGILYSVVWYGDMVWPYTYSSEHSPTIWSCKFKSLSLFSSLEIDSLHGLQTQKKSICMTKCRAGFTTGLIVCLYCAELSCTVLCCVALHLEAP